MTEAIHGCMRVSDAFHVAPGSHVKACEDCGEPVYCSPATMVACAGYDVKRVCLQCMQKLGPLDIQPITEGQRRELEAFDEGG